MKRIKAAFLACLATTSIAVADHESGGVRSQSTLTRAGARSVLDRAVAEARRLNAPGGAIAVVDAGGQLLCLECLDGTFAAAANIAIGKATTAARFRKPTSAFEDLIRGGRTPMLALEQFTPLQGGVPVVHDGIVVGAVGVSGAASAAQDDEIAQFASRALDEPSFHESNESTTVAYIPTEKVASAFDRGAPILDGENGEEYRIHASRRDGPGMAEVHLAETDIIYVREGSATFVTGGQLLNETMTSNVELRGDGIVDGRVHQLSGGDVIVVPRGTPHWFKDVNGPFTYFVVKVRNGAM